jgi:hypothetical protein
MPARWCQCRGCPACGTTTGTHGKLYDREAAPGFRCPPCQGAYNQRKQQRRDNTRGTTTQRGYGPRHQKMREELLKKWQPGDPCAHCGQPMWTSIDLDLAHTPDRTAYRGLAHAACNRGNR